MSDENYQKKPITLNYSKLKSQIEKTGLSIRQFSLGIERSESWFFSAERNSSMRVDDLCLICDKLCLPIETFFDNNLSTMNREDLLTEREILQRILAVNKQMVEELKKLSKV